MVPSGIGIYINTSTGLVHVHNCHVHSNAADGLKLVQHELQIPRREVDGAAVSDFCSSGTTLDAVFPIFTAAQQFRTRYRSRRCQKVSSPPPPSSSALATTPGACQKVSSARPPNSSALATTPDAVRR